jgi:hypothetical protein
METEKLDGYDGGWRTLRRGVAGMIVIMLPVELAYAELPRRFLLNLQAIARRITAIPHNC